MKNPAIVIAAFNRAESLKRLLGMIARAEYSGLKNVTLVISIDGGGAKEVHEIADAFEWQFGSKEVVLGQKNLGLKEHILQCGDLTKRFGSIIMLEDDLGLSRYFYQYAVHALEAFSGNDLIAGISLYKHPRNVHVGASFQALDTGAGYYLQQFAQSWGQVWESGNWRNFRNWLEEQVDYPVDLDVPKYVRFWPDSSWLKWHIAYLIAQEKYFVYPTQSYSTNFCECGTNVDVADNRYQVALANYLQTIDGTQERVIPRYDAYFEIESDSLSQFLNTIFEDVVIDLYGYRNLEIYDPEKKVLTIRDVKHYESQWAMRLRPREFNVICDVKGEGICITKIKHVSNDSCVAMKEFMYVKEWPGIKSFIKVMNLAVLGKLRKRGWNV